MVAGAAGAAGVAGVAGAAGPAGPAKAAAGVRCVELYGGVGTIGLNCHDLLSSLRCSDENPYNQACFAQAAASVHLAVADGAGPGPGPAVGCACAYESAGAAAVAARGGLQGCDVVIVDPPRKVRCWPAGKC